MNPSIFIETDRLYLRQWQLSDYAAFIEMNSDTEVMRYFPSTLLPEQSMALIGRITKQIDESGYGLFAVEKKEDHSFIGFTGFSHPRFEAYFTPCIEIGWRLHNSYWNKGFATEAAKACIAYGFEKLKFNDIYSFTSVQNKPSERVMQKIGMQPSGIFDHPMLEDGHILQKHLLYKIIKGEGK
jgi:RimJ/RimL family protein N-acetyltransferase